MAESLWPEFSPANINDPKVVIEEQAKILPKLTNEKVLAIVEKAGVDAFDFASHENYSFIYDFRITSKMLPSYNFLVFVFSYNLPVYPLKLSIDIDILKELGLREGLSFRTSSKVNNEEELLAILKSILTSKKVRDVVSSIMKIT